MKIITINSLYSRINTFWIVLNNEPVVNKIRTVNKRNNANKIMKLEFSTLSTKIPHKKLSKVKYKSIDFCFRGCQSTYITITIYRDKWISDPSVYL